MGKLRLPKRKHIADNDGEFWMSAQDWGDRLSKYEICRLNTEDFDNEGHWHEESFNGEWSESKGTAGGLRTFKSTFCNNPYQIVNLSGGSESDQVLVCLQ